METSGTTRLGRLAFMVLLSVRSPTVNAESAQAMLAKCRRIAAGDVRSDAAGREMVSLDQSFDSGVCWGAFQVIQEVTTMMEPEKDQRVLGVCSPGESNRLQLVLIS